MNRETLPAQGPVDVNVGRANSVRMLPLMRSMLMRASHITAPHSTLVTEHVGDTCIQCEGRPTFRRTLDGLQPTISFHWFVNCSVSTSEWRGGFQRDA